MPNYLVSVDPGVRACGVAIWAQVADERMPPDAKPGVLHGAGYVRNPLTRGQDTEAACAMGRAVGSFIALAVGSGHHRLELVIECPRVYDAAFQKGDQNTSIIPLSLVVGAVGMCQPFWKVTQYFPRDWKGTADADRVVIPLVQSRVKDFERARVQLPAESLAHNVWDGIGVGLKLLGRLEPHRVFHREP